MPGTTKEFRQCLLRPCHGPVAATGSTGGAGGGAGRRAQRRADVVVRPVVFEAFDLRLH